MQWTIYRWSENAQVGKLGAQAEIILSNDANRCNWRLRIMTQLSKRVGLFVALAFLAFSSVAQAQELKIRGPIASITKKKAVVTGSVPRSSRCFKIRATAIKEIKGKRARIGVKDNEYKGLWLGVTVFITDAAGRTEERDFPARRVTGHFKETYTAYGGSILDGATKTIWVARLWEGKVYQQACAEWNNGRPCEYCERNGYHMYAPTGARAKW